MVPTVNAKKYIITMLRIALPITVRTKEAVGLLKNINITPIK